MKCSKCGAEYDGKYCDNCYSKSDIEKINIFDFEDEKSSEPINFSMFQQDDSHTKSTDDSEQSKVFNFDDEESVEPITDYNPYPNEDKATQSENHTANAKQNKASQKSLVISISIVAILLVFVTVALVMELIGVNDTKNIASTEETTIAETTMPVTHITPATIDEVTPYPDDYYYDISYETYLEEYKKLEDGEYNGEAGYFHKDSGFYYRQTGNGMKITGFEKYYDIDTLPTEITIEIPSEINGLPVTDIDQVGSMFCLQEYINYYYRVNKLIESADYQMSDSYFESMLCDPLERIYIKLIVPHSVRTLRVGAFSYSYDIDEIVIEDGATTIEENAFIECGSLKKLTIPPTVTYMAECMAGLKYDYDSFYSDLPKPIEGFTICGDYGSTAQDYADKHGITFEQA